MNNLIKKLVAVLKDHINQNNRDIQLNEDEINKLLSNPQNARKIDLDNRYSQNRQMLNENSDFIKMQLELEEFKEKYKHLFPPAAADGPFKGAAEGDSHDLLLKTVSGQLKFDNTHPRYNNPQFLQELINYYESQENYEMCEILIRLRKQ